MSNLKELHSAGGLQLELMNVLNGKGSQLSEHIETQGVFGKVK